MEGLIEGLDEYFTPKQRRVIVEGCAERIAQVLGELPDKLRDMARRAPVRTDFDRGVREGLLITADLVAEFVRTAKSL